MDDPGGNTIRDSGSASSSFCNLWVGDVPDAVEAVGNTWNAGEQNADEDGRYVPADGEDHVELTGQLLSTGYKNVRIQQVGDVVKL